MKTVTAFISIILFASNSLASGQCAQLKQELKAMQSAQQQIVASLVSNHESFASSMEEYSSLIRSAQGPAVSSVSTKMSDSAQAFRVRGIQGKKMATQLNVATGDLLARIASCLK